MLQSVFLVTASVHYICQIAIEAYYPHNREGLQEFFSQRTQIQLYTWFTRDLGFLLDFGLSIAIIRASFPHSPYLLAEEHWRDFWRRKDEKSIYFITYCDFHIF
jgi:hypothetical protein